MNVKLTCSLEIDWKEYSHYLILPRDKFDEYKIWAWEAFKDIWNLLLTEFDNNNK
jgi:hypothetical protein